MLLRHVLIAYLQDVTRLMSEVSSGKHGKNSDASVWQGMREYIAKAKPEELQADLRQLSEVIRRGQTVRIPLFALKELRSILAQAAWHMEDTAERYASSECGRVLAQLSSIGSAEMFAQEVARFIGRTGGARRVLVQSAAELDQEMRQKMLTSLMKSKEFVLPTFRVDRALLGGVRVFHGGQLADDTWLGRARKLIRFTREKGVV